VPGGHRLELRVLKLDPAGYFQRLRVNNVSIDMYAVIKSGGKQHRVEAGEILRLEKLEVSEGESVDFDEVMMIGEGTDVEIGAPFVEGGKVTAEVLSHGKGTKVTIVKMRRRKHYRRQGGHRQLFTEVKIKEITRS